MSTEVKTAILEFLRMVVFAIPGFLILVIQAHPTLLGGTIGALILVVLKAIDRAVHESTSTTATGLLPF